MLQGVGRVFFGIACLALGFVAVATSVPQRKKLEAMEAELELVKAREREVAMERDFVEIEYQALRSDPAYLEVQARDRLDYFRDGERVLKFRNSN